MKRKRRKLRGRRATPTEQLTTTALTVSLLPAATRIAEARP